MRAAGSSRSASVDPPWRLASRAPPGREHERNVGVRRDGQTEEPAEHDLPRRRAHEIRSADDLADTLLGIVDDDGELVGGHAVGSAHDEVVDDAAAAAEQAILELDALVVGAEAQRVRPSAVDPCPALRGRQLAARARVGALRQITMRRRRGGPDLGSGAEALVEPTLGAECLECAVVERAPLRLSDHRPVPVDPERVKVIELPTLELATRALRVKVLDPDEEPRPPERANSHATNAVRRLPRWSGPVGEGAKRPSCVTGTLSRTWRLSWASPRSQRDLAIEPQLPLEPPVVRGDDERSGHARNAASSTSSDSMSRWLVGSSSSRHAARWCAMTVSAARVRSPGDSVAIAARQARPRVRTPRARCGRRVRRVR